MIIEVGDLVELKGDRGFMRVDEIQKDGTIIQRQGGEGGFIRRHAKTYDVERVGFFANKFTDIGPHCNHIWNNQFGYPGQHDESKPTSVCRKCNIRVKGHKA